jgi:hypothetical protein
MVTPRSLVETSPLQPYAGSTRSAHRHPSVTGKKASNVFGAKPKTYAERPNSNLGRRPGLFPAE